MAKKKAEFTMWTIPATDWTVIEGMTLTEESSKEMEDEIKQRAPTGLEDRLGPFDTPVTNETLSKSIK